MATINKSDYVQFKYGRPELHKISDSNVFGVTAEDKQSKRTTVREHFTGFKSEPAKQIKWVRFSKLLSFYVLVLLSCGGIYSYNGLKVDFLVLPALGLG